MPKIIKDGTFTFNSFSTTNNTSSKTGAKIGNPSDVTGKALHVIYDFLFVFHLIFEWKVDRFITVALLISDVLSILALVTALAKEKPVVSEPCKWVYFPISTLD